MSEGASLNAAQARAVAKLITDEVGIDGKLFVENEFYFGTGIIKASVPQERAANSPEWLIGEDGGVIKL